MDASHIGFDPSRQIHLRSRGYRPDCPAWDLYYGARLCRRRRLARVLDHPVQVAVNVYSIQFVRDCFVDEVAQVLQQTGLKGSLLQIELTESAMLTGADRAADTIQRLRLMGISVAIDDFGTGYSCLSYRRGWHLMP